MITSAVSVIRSSHQAVVGISIGIADDRVLRGLLLRHEWKRNHRGGLGWRPCDEPMRDLSDYAVFIEDGSRITI